MNKKRSKIVAGLLALAMILTSSVGMLPASEVQAATKTMAHLKSGSGNGNGHFGADKPEAFVLSDKADITDEALNVQVKFAGTIAHTRFRFVTKYVSDTQWAYLAYDDRNGNGHWFYEYKNGAESGWPDLTGLPNPNQGDVLNISTEYTDAGLKVTVENVTTGERGTATIAAKLKTEAGKIGVGSATFGTEYTEVYFADVKAGSHVWSSYNGWTPYRPSAEGQVWEAAASVDIGGETPDPQPPVGGRKWITIESGARGGSGHAYGNASVTAPALLLDQDRTMPNGGSLSLSVKPQNDNWGVFYSYVDDNNWLYVGYDKSSQWYYQYKIAGQEKYPKISGLPDPVIGEELKLSIAVDREVMRVTVNDTPVTFNNQDLFAFNDGTVSGGKFGVKVNGANQSISFADVKCGTQNCMEDTWAFAADRGHTFREETTPVRTVSGKVTDAEGNAVEGATVRFGVNSARSGADGNYAVNGVEVGTYAMTATKMGYLTYEESVEVTENGENVFNVTLEDKPPLDLTKYDSIESDEMKVYIGKKFPVVARYEMGAAEDFFRGNENELNAIVINGVSIEPEVTVSETTKTSRTYKMHVEDAESRINLDMSVKISVKETDLTWEVTELKKADGCVKIKTIDIPELNLLTVEASEEGANFAGAKKSTVTTESGDVYVDFEQGFVPSEKSSSYLYGFLSNGKFSAGLQSNSEIEGDVRVKRNNGADTMSLTSAAWYYEAGDVNGQKYGADYPVSELPCARVAIGADENKDGEIDWNDGALAFRDVMHMAQGAEVMKDMVNYRIVMNFASMAPNPFLATADNIKKVYLATDGLPQSVMLKGYGNEGHDSANSEYADIAEREGGVEDFRDLIRIAHDYNTEIGIHVNAQEAYPESKSFNEEMIESPTSHGWGWLDQSIAIDKLWDLSSAARYKRFVQLFDRINETSLLSLDWEKGEYVGESGGTLASDEEIAAAVKTAGEDNMDFIYLDVWYQNAWETRRIAEEINSLGWRFSTEFSDQGEYDSTWQHWATDAAYGGAGMKGFNSDIIRFIRNDQRDSQVLNYPSYGGTADNPLLGGYRLYGFEGWGGDQDYNNYIKQTFNQNLPTKFLQHYIVTDWENYEDGSSPVGNHEKQITLKSDPKDENADTVIVTRNAEQRGDDEIEREIQLNGRTVLSTTADHSYYLLPWTDNQTGEEKLYHWNLNGGTSTWQLPEGWDSAVMYELTDQGRINETTVGGGGSVTIDAKAATPYVLVKGASVKTLKNDFGEKDYVVDPGFNGYAAGEQLSSDEWSGDIADASVVVEKANTGDQRLAFNSPSEDVEVTTGISGLTVGIDYVAEVNIENNSDAKAYIKVKSGSKEVSNYTERSIAGNYIQCDVKNDSKMQRMQISFTAEGDTAQLTLARENGEGSTYVDDIRIVEKKLTNYKEDGSFVQDFETVVQGLYPFVLGPAQGVSDPRTHLSQLHEPYTQQGFGGKPIDDVLEGNWSLKHHQRSTGIVYQTIPQNFRFEPGKVYTVEFDYQSAPDGAYAMVVGDGTTYQLPEEDGYLEGTGTLADAKTKHATMQVIGSGSGQTWIGLYENNSKLRIPEVSGNAEDNFEVNVGYQDFVLDNLKITEEKDAVAVTISATELYKGETADIYGSGLDKITWTSSKPEVAVADAKAGKVNALSAGTTTLTASADGKTVATFEVTVTDTVVVEIPRDEYAGISSSANTEETALEAAGAAKATDGDSATFWHSNYGSNPWNPANGPAVLTVDLGKEMAIGGFKFQQRPSANNGIVERYRYEILDGSENVLVTGESKETTAEERAGGAWITVPVEELSNARYIKIYVEEGQGGFAAIAEVQPIRIERVAEGAELKDVTLKAGEKVTLEPKPVNGTMLKGLVWTSSDKEVADVNQSGVVTALKAGSAKITVTNAAGLKAECTVTVEGEVVVEKPEAPKNVAAGSITASEAKISWEKTEGADAYEVYLNGELYSTTENTTITLTGLKPETEYRVSVKAKNQAGTSEATEITFTTKKQSGGEGEQEQALPTQPKGLKVTDVTKDSMKVTWKAADEKEGVTEYLIYLNGEKVYTFGKADMDQAAGASEYGVAISGLVPGTCYKIGVVAVNAKGKSAMALTEAVTKGESGTESTPIPEVNVRPVKTGDFTPVTGLLAVFLLAGGAVLIMLRRRAEAGRTRRHRR